MTTDVSETGTFCGTEEISIEDGRRLLDEAARRTLNMTADEFIEAWDEGLFADPDSLRVQQVVALLPFGR